MTLGTEFVSKQENPGEMAQGFTRLETQRGETQNKKSFPSYCFRGFSYPLESLPSVEVIFRCLNSQVSSNTAVGFFERCEIEDSSGFSPHETVIGLKALETIRIYSDRLEIIDHQSQKSVVRVSQIDPFTLLQSRLRSHQRISLQKEGFQGGYMGTFGYECVKFLEPCLAKKKGFQSIQDPLGELVLFSEYIVLDHQKESIHLVQEDSHSESSLALPILAEACAFRCRSSDSSYLGEKTDLDQKEDLPEMSAELGEEAFCQKVQQIREKIQNGEIFQAVLTDRLSCCFSGSAEELFLMLRQMNSTSYRYFIRNSDRVLMGASPETLIRGSGDEVEANPIAGTRPQRADRAQSDAYEKELCESSKEKAEHRMLVDLARHDLGRVAQPGSVDVNEYMEPVHYPGVIHLVSKIKAELRDDQDAIDALKASFPAGTLSGAPKIRALEILSDLEPFSRGEYGGSFVIAGLDGFLDSCITIRSLFVHQGRITAQAGAGIVMDSQPKREYQEVLNKMKAVRLAIAQAQNQTPLFNRQEEVKAG